MEYDPITNTMSYKFIEGKTIYNPFTDEIVPLYPMEPGRKKGEVRNDSIKRAINKAFKIGCSNDFRYFITITIHFHGLISADNLHLEDSGKQTEAG